MWPGESHCCVSAVLGQGTARETKRRTVEDPRAGVVGDDAERDALAGGDLHGVAPHGVRLRLVDGRVERRVVGRIVRCAFDDLEFVSVQMAIYSLCQLSQKRLWIKQYEQRMFPGIAVHNLDVHGVPALKDVIPWTVRGGNVCGSGTRNLVQGQR